MEPANRSAPDGHAPAGLPLTANERLKRSFGSCFWVSMIVAVVVHFSVISFWPDLRAADVSFSLDDVEVIDLPHELEMPPPPEEIQRPANPVVSEAQIDDDITIPLTTMEDNPPDDLPPPPVTTDEGLGEQPVFVPVEVMPELLNPDEVQRALENEYPSTLRDAGIGGEVILHILIDENGAAQRVVIAGSSGYDTMDRAAARIAEVMRFSPAVNRNERVPVWIEQGIRFVAR